MALDNLKPGGVSRHDLAAVWVAFFSKMAAIFAVGVGRRLWWC